MAKGDAYKRWVDEEVVQVTIRPSRKYDPDIVAALERAAARGESKSSEALRLMRQGIKAEKEGWV